MKCVKRLAILGVAALWLGSGGFQRAQGVEVQQVAARFEDGEPITTQDMLPLFHFYTLGLDALFLEEAPDYKAYLEAVVLETVMGNRLIQRKAQALGLDGLSEEEQKVIRQEGLDTYEEEVKEYASGMETTLEEARALFDEKGLTVDCFILWEMEKMRLTQLKAEVTRDIAVSDAEFDQLLKELEVENKAIYQDNPEGYDAGLGVYEEQLRNAQLFQREYVGYPPLYRPEGIRGIKTILIGVEDFDRLYSYLAARAELAQGHMAPEAVEEKRQAVLATVEKQTEAIAQRYAAGESFDSLIAAYGNDPAMDRESCPSTGYELCRDSKRFDEAFVSAAFAIEKAGELSQPVVTSRGVEVLLLVGELPEEAVEMPEEQKTVLRQRTLESRKETAFWKTYEQWVLEDPVEYTGIVAKLADVLDRIAKTATDEGTP